MAEESSLNSSDGGPTKSYSPGFGMRTVIKAIKLKYSSIMNVATEDLAGWLSAPSERAVVLLDARPEEEYVVSHMKHSIRIDYETDDILSLVEMCDEKLKDKPQPSIVCYCSVGYRSSAIADKLQEFYGSHTDQQPIPAIFNLEGSLFKWANERRPMVDSNGQPTIYAHPYSGVWGKLLDKSLRKEYL